MFGAFRFTNPLSGGLLWYERPLRGHPICYPSARPPPILSRAHKIDHPPSSPPPPPSKPRPVLTSSRILWLTRHTRRHCRKTPWRLSRFQKARQRRRLRAVDAVVDTLDKALAKKGVTLKALEVWKETMPTEAEMLPRDKYTMFDRKEKRYRKGIHKLPKWTRVSQRVNPPGY
ncbi:hypothetical protein DL771_000143 [Monosporascus sp. 5C6A]|nr:hypothetical protein DL771_000143 [Monosporascus sp. 5C6A]